LEEDARTGLFLKELCIAFGDNTELIKKISYRESTQAFNMLQMIILHNAIMCIGRIWDKSSPDRNSLPTLIKHFEKHPWLTKHYGDETRTWPGNPEKNFTYITTLLKEIKNEYEKFIDLDFKTTFKSLKDFRDIHIAHRLRKDYDGNFKYSELYDMISRSHEIISKLYLCITGISIVTDEDDDSYAGIYKKTSEALIQDLILGLPTPKR